MHTRGPRLTFFILGIVGGLLAGVGAITAWRTTASLGDEIPTKGIDTPAGKIALAFAVAAIILTLATRKGHTEEPRTWTLTVLLFSGIALVLIGGLAAAQLDAIYGDARVAAAQKIAKALNDNGVEATVDDVLAQMDKVETRRPEPGPWLLLAGGVLLLAGAGTGFLWRRAWNRTAAEAGASSDLTEGPDGPDAQPTPGTTVASNDKPGSS
jgi:hypothetical protein